MTYWDELKKRIQKKIKEANKDHGSNYKQLYFDGKEGVYTISFFDGVNYRFAKDKIWELEL